VHQHAARLEGDFRRAGTVRQPVDDGRNTGIALVAARVAHHVLQQQAQHDGQPWQVVAEQLRQIDHVIALAGVVQPGWREDWDGG